MAYLRHRSINGKLCWLLAGLSVLGLCGPVAAYFADFTNGVRPAGMGEAFVAVADDSNTLLFNPAGLAQIQEAMLSTMYSDIYSNLNAGLYTEENDRLGYNSVFLGVTLGEYIGGAGFGWTQFTSMLYEENTFTLAYGKKIWWPHYLDLGIAMEIGTQAKVLQWAVRNSEVTNNQEFYPSHGGRQKVGATGGVGLHLSFSDRLRLGASVDYLVPVDMGMFEEEVIPVFYRAGAAYDITFSNALLDNVLLAAEITKRKDEYVYKFGAESWWWQKTVALRTGVNNERFTSGFSYCFHVANANLDIQLDYAFSYPFYVHETWGSHRLGLSVDWGGGGAKPDEQDKRAIMVAEAANSVVKSINLAKSAAVSAEKAMRYAAFYIQARRFEEAKQAVQQAKEEAETAALAAKAATAVASDTSKTLAVKATEATAASYRAVKWANKAEETYIQFMEKQKLHRRSDTTPVQRHYFIREKYPDKIVIGIDTQVYSDFGQAAEIKKLFATLQTYLAHMTDMPLEWKFYSAPELELAFKQGEVDIFVSYGMNTGTFYRQGLIKPVLTVQKHYKDTQRCNLIVREDSGDLAKSQLKNKRLGYTKQRLIEKMNAYFPETLGKMPPADYFRGLDHYKNSSDLLLALVFEEVDVIIEFEYILDLYQKIQTPKGIKVLAQSDPVPNCPVFIKATKNRKKGLEMEKLVEAMKTLHTKPEAKKIFERFEIDRFVEFDEKRHKKYLLER